MLAKGTKVLAFYSGTTSNGELIEAVGTKGNPAELTIGDHRLPSNVSVALATMEEGERREVKAAYRVKGSRPVIAVYDVCLVEVPKIGFIEDEILHGSECACGCHKLREALSPVNVKDKGGCNE